MLLKNEMLLILIPGEAFPVLNILQSAVKNKQCPMYYLINASFKLDFFQTL